LNRRFARIIADGKNLCESAAKRLFEINSADLVVLQTHCAEDVVSAVFEMQAVEKNMVAVLVQFAEECRVVTAAGALDNEV